MGKINNGSKNENVILLEQGVIYQGRVQESMEIWTRSAKARSLADALIDADPF